MGGGSQAAGWSGACWEGTVPIAGSLKCLALHLMKLQYLSITSITYSAACLHRLQVDGTNERLLMRRLAVDSFPSLFLIDRSSTRKYQGIRAVEQVRVMPC